MAGRFGNSEYGRSKKAGEDLFLEYGKGTGAKVLVYRFPNLYGKWKDPISVNNAWISGGYINLYCSWTGHKNSGVVQRSAFVLEGTSTGIDNAPDTLSFSLVHDSEGDGFSSGGDVTNQIGRASCRERV